MVGGTDLKICVKLIINRLMTNQLQRKFNMEGKSSHITPIGSVKRGFALSTSYAVLKGE